MMFIVLIVVIWVVALGVWWFGPTRSEPPIWTALRAACWGPPSRRKKRPRPGPPCCSRKSPAAWFLKIIRRFRLQEHLKEVLEQAGLKWTPLS